MKLYQGIVISNEHITERYYHLKILCSALAQEVKEGQIIHLGIGEDADPILRRPFSVYRFNRVAGIIELMYIVKGKGTAWMKELKKEDTVDLLGPGGNYYEIDANVKGIAILGRGVGIASIVSLGEKAREQGKEVIALLSARSKEAIIGKELLGEMGCCVIAVNDEDGSSSIENVMKILEENLEKYGIGQIFTCGSNRVARLARELGQKYKIPAYVSLEEHMACGIGVCHGCVCETKQGYKTVCKDGPIFNVEEVCLS
ncbi:dihydroorotate dehydrogenase electron transfer subunit [Clostridiaceae bacterium 35-E11]